MVARVGLTGGIGSGKSTVAEWFAGKGITIIDADQVARDITVPGTPTFKAIEAKFGSMVVQEDGTLDRAFIAEAIYADEKLRKWLEDLMHPPIREEMDKQAKKCKGPYCILEIPLLVETGRHEDMDCVIVVQSPYEMRIEHLTRLRKVPRERVERAIKIQATDEERLAKADILIENDGDLATLKDRCKVAMKQLTDRFS